METNEVLTFFILVGVSGISLYFGLPVKEPKTGEHIGDDLAKLIIESQELFNQGKYEEVLDKVDELISRFSWKTKYSYSLRAMSLEKLGFYLDSIEDYSSVIKIQNNDANTYFLRGLVHFKLGHFDESLLDLNKATSLDPNNEEYETYLRFFTETVNPEIESITREKAILNGFHIRRVS